MKIRNRDETVKNLLDANYFIFYESRRIAHGGQINLRSVCLIGDSVKYISDAFRSEGFPDNARTLNSLAETMWNQRGPNAEYRVTREYLELLLEALASLSEASMISARFSSLDGLLYYIRESLMFIALAVESLGFQDIGRSISEAVKEIDEISYKNRVIGEGNG